MKILFLFQPRVLLVAALLAIGVALAAESPSILLQKGIYAEEIERNLDSAIKIYEQIAREAATSRAVVAQAQYRLAVCYQKKGDKEQAVRLFNELVQQPTTDAGVSKQAREGLAAMGVPPREAVSVRRIKLSGSPGHIVAVSPAGDLVAYHLRDSQDLFVEDLVTGKTQLVAKDADTWGHSPPAQFSPDGQWIGYDYQEAGIHIAKTDGTEVRKLFDATGNDGKKHWNEMVGWSADGTQALMAQWDYARECRVVVALDAHTGAATEIAPVAYRDKDQWVFAEDTKYIARRAGNYPTAVTLLELKSGSEEIVLDHDAESVVGWLARPTRLVYSKVGNVGLEIWTREIKDGKAAGAPRFAFGDSTGVLSSGRSYPLQVTRDGRIFYAVLPGKPNPAELWVFEGVLPGNAGAGNVANSGLLMRETPPEELVRSPDGSVHDEKFGLSLQLPAGWKIVRAGRSNTGFSALGFDGAGFKSAWMQMGYWLTGSNNNPEILRLHQECPKPSTTSEVDAWLKKYAQLKAEGRVNRDHYSNYKPRPESFVARTIGGHRALSWLADYTLVNGKAWVEYVTIIYGDAVVVQPFAQASPEQIDAVRSSFDLMIETIRSP